MVEEESANENPEEASQEVPDESQPEHHGTNPDQIETIDMFGQDWLRVDMSGADDADSDVLVEETLPT